MSTQEHYDLVILGSGSTAFAAAIHAQELGKTAVMTEGRTLGGTCVNRGCLPSKNLIEAARLVYDAAHPRYPGLWLHRPRTGPDVCPLWHRGDSRDTWTEYPVRLRTRNRREPDRDSPRGGTPDRHRGTGTFRAP